jgi:hypothetical protein
LSTLSLPLKQSKVATRLHALTIYHVGACAVFLVVFMLAVVPRFDTDLWWHLFVGHQILDHHSVPTTDTLSYTFKGQSWIDHEWLSEAIMSALYGFGGFQALFIVFGLVTTAAFVAAYTLMRLKGVPALLGLLVTGLAASASVGSMGPRIQMVSLLFAALACIALDRYRISGESLWLYGLIGLIWIWSNLHGGFVIGLVLIAGYAIGGMFDGFRSGWSRGVALQSQKPLFVTLGLSLLVTLINPNTYHQLLYPLKFITPNAFTNAIQESQSPNFHLAQMLPFELMAIGLVVVAFLARSRASWVDIVLVAVFAHLALQQTRNVPLFAVVVAPIIAFYLHDALHPAFNRFKSMNREVSHGLVVTVLNVVLLLGLVAIGVAQTAKDVGAAQVTRASHGAYPHWAALYLQHHVMPGNGFNSYNYGGFLIWTQHGKVPTFIDSRADTVFSTSLLHDYLTLYDVQNGWQNVLKDYKIQWVFVEKDAPLAQVLAENPRWRVVFLGGLATIIERRNHA